MKKFVVKPDLDLYTGIVVKKDTKLEFENEKVKQTLEDLKLKSKITTKDTGNGVNTYESVTDLTIYLNDNDILLFEEERGYFLPNIPMSTIEDAITDVEVLRNFDK